MGRPPCCDKSNVKRGLWTEEEDLKLIAYTNTHGVGNWTSVPRKAGLKRCGKSCRLRWTNYLRPNLKHESFTPQEEEMIVTLHATIGSRWSIIANHLPGRTDNDIKNHWNTKLSKRLYQQGIDPVTHKPISQIMESIGNLSATQNHQYRRAVLSLDGRISCLSRDLKNVFLSKPTASPAVPNPFEVLQQQPFSITTAVDEGSSSSSTTAATAFCADVSQDDLKWSDFLVDDVFLSYNQEDGSSCAHSSNNVGVSGVNENWMVTGNGKEQVVEEEVSSALFGGPDGGSCSTSFVDAILDQEREMIMEFPEFFCDQDSLL